MAKNTHKAESAHNNPLTFTLSPGMAPAAPMMRLLTRFDREKVEAFAEVSIALLDLVDGDPDLEPDDHGEEDDASGQYDEDYFTADWKCKDGGAGCPISDPGGCEHDGREQEEGVNCAGYGEDQTKLPGNI